MSDPRQPEISAELVAGRFEGINVPDLLWMLCRTRKTGVLRLRDSHVSKTVYVENGQLVFASSSAADDRLGEQLLRREIITLAQLEAAQARLDTGKRLGTLLVEGGGLTAEQLVEGVISQVRSITMDLFTWDEGEYRFEEGPLPTDEVITLGMKTSELLLQGIQRIRSLTRVMRSVGPPETVYALAASWQISLEGVGLREGEELLVERLRHGDASVQALCDDLFLSNFQIYQTLWALRVLGVVEELDPDEDSPHAATYSGSLARHHVSEVLVRLGQAEETGVLYLSRGSRERTLHLDRGRSVFATSNDPDDGLVAFLVRRGVITLRDRRETEQRMLTNKRTGTILREIGVIDGDDLDGMVRQQLSEIIYDTFRWSDGDYVFVQGPLPTIEEITIDASTEMLVNEGMRRVSSWGGIKAGCGGLDASLVLAPSYLDVLDRFNAGPEEWDIITALKSPKSPKELCRESELHDFRLCQVLWALRVLGAVEAAPVVEDEVVPEAEAEAGSEESAACSVDETVIDDEIAAREAIPQPAVDAPEVQRAADAGEPGPVGTGVGAWEHEAEASERESSPDALEPRSASETSTPLHIDRVEPPAVELSSEDDEASSEGAGIEFDPSVTRKIDRSALRQALEQDAIDREGSVEEQDVSAPNEDPAPAEQGPPADEPGEVAPSLLETQRIDPAAFRAALFCDAAESAGHDEPPSEAVPEVAETPDGGASETEAVDEEIRLAPDLGQIDDGWEPPSDLEQIIHRFNAIQRIVYKAVRSEIGAGAANFIRACCDDYTRSESDPLFGAELQADGTWGADALKRSVMTRRVCDPWPEYQELIEREIEILRSHIGEAKVLELQREVERIDPPTRV